jgi:hypothetical protein
MRNLRDEAPGLVPEEVHWEVYYGQLIRNVLLFHVKGFNCIAVSGFPCQSGRGKREPGENPGRWGHCEWVAAFHRATGLALTDKGTPFNSE